MLLVVFFFQAEDGIRDLVRSRGLGDVYKRQVHTGRLDGTGTAHEAMDDMMTAKGLHLRFAAVEEYVTDPAQEPDTSKWVTNICYPVE